MDIDLFFLGKIYGEKQHLLCRLYYLLHTFWLCRFHSCCFVVAANDFLSVVKTPFAFHPVSIYVLFLKDLRKNFPIHMGQNAEYVEQENVLVRVH